MIEILTIEEVALLLKLHPRTVMKMAAAGEIPGAKVGRKWRFDRVLIEEWLAQRMASPRWMPSLAESSAPVPGRLLTPEQVVVVNTPQSKSKILFSLASRVSPRKLGRSADELFALLLEREAMFPTATEYGVAFPHPRHPLPSLEEPVLAMAVVPEGVEFGAPDNVPIYVFVMVCSPDDRTHLQLLAQLSRVFRVPNVVEQIRKCSTPDQVVKVFQEAESTALADLLLVQRSV